jgi:hypothetical protein
MSMQAVQHYICLGTGAVMLDRLFSTVFDATEPLRLHGVLVCSNPPNFFPKICHLLILIFLA